jgi:regulatory protein
MDDFGKFYLKAVHFLKYRPRSVKEVRDKLLEKKAPEDIIDNVIDKLIEQKFLNDETFAQMWVRSRSEMKPRSLWVIKRELQQKGISEDIIEKLLGEKDKAETDFKAAKLIVEKKIHKYQGLERQETYQKLGAFLARRGFNWDTIKKSIDQVLDTKSNK